MVLVLVVDLQGLGKFGLFLISVCLVYVIYFNLFVVIGVSDLVIKNLVSLVFFEGREV